MSFFHEMFDYLGHMLKTKLYLTLMVCQIVSYVTDSSVTYTFQVKIIYLENKCVLSLYHIFWRWKNALLSCFLIFLSLCFHDFVLLFFIKSCFHFVVNIFSLLFSSFFHISVFINSSCFHVSSGFNFPSLFFSIFLSSSSRPCLSFISLLLSLSF